MRMWRILGYPLNYESFDPSKPMYRNDFDQFLNDKYGFDPDPFEAGDFNW